RLARLDLCAGIFAARTWCGWRDTIAPAVWKEARCGPSRLLCRAAERCESLRATPLEPPESGLWLPARVLAAGDTGPVEKRVSARTAVLAVPGPGRPAGTDSGRAVGHAQRRHAYLRCGRVSSHQSGGL